MENLKFINYILLGIMFLLTCFANLSTRQNKREWFYLGFALTAIAYFISYYLVSSYQDHPSESRDIFYLLFLGIGVTIPQLISRTIIRQKIMHPVVFLQKNKPSIILIIFFILFAIFFAIQALQPNQYYANDHTPVYDEFYIKSSFSFLLCYIPALILLLEIQTVRTAFCENGLYNYGLILDWNNFNSYAWLNPKIDDPKAWVFLDENQNDTLILAPAKAIIKKPIKIFVPLSQKIAIDEFLSQRIKLDSD